MKIHCVIISWQGFYNNTVLIAEQVVNSVDDLTIVYSNQMESEEYGPGTWIRTPNDWFYGRKFKKALDCIRDDEVLLLIQADVSYRDWPELIDRCRDVMENINHVGVWAPDITETSWTEKRVYVAGVKELKIEFVAQTDGIVFCYSQDIIRRLKELNYENNNLGWGIDWAAICYSLINNKLVIRDASIVVNHKAGSGYLINEAANQMRGFLTQLTPQEVVMYKILDAYTSYSVSELRQSF